HHGHRRSRRAPRLRGAPGQLSPRRPERAPEHPPARSRPRIRGRTALAPGCQLHQTRWPDESLLLLRWSGKEALLPTPTPLRTARAPCDACSASLLERLSRDAVWSRSRLLAVDLTVAVGMEQRQVVQAVLAAVHAPDPVVDLPLLLLLQELPAATTAS